MQSDNKIEGASEEDHTKENSGDDLSRPWPQWLPRWLFAAIGPIALIVLVVGGVAAYYAYYHVTKDSVRFQFWVGFMFSFLAFVVLLVQSVIYAQQAEFMKQQSKSMQDTVERTDRMIENMQGQLISMRNQEQSMQGQLEAMECQTEYANRAYVCIPSASLKVVQEIGTKKQVEMFWFRVENTGITPANSVCVRSFSGIAAEIPDPALLATMKAGHQQQVGVIAPRAHAYYFVRVPELSSEEIAQWVDGKIDVYCSGFITYKSFGKIRTTKFCLLRRPGASGDFESYGKWSEAD